MQVQGARALSVMTCVVVLITTPSWAEERTKAPYVQDAIQASEEVKKALEGLDVAITEFECDMLRIDVRVWAKTREALAKAEVALRASAFLKARAAREQVVWALTPSKSGAGWAGKFSVTTRDGGPEPAMPPLPEGDIPVKGVQDAIQASGLAARYVSGRFFSPAPEKGDVAERLHREIGIVGGGPKASERFPRKKLDEVLRRLRKMNDVRLVMLEWKTPAPGKDDEVVESVKVGVGGWRPRRER